MNKTILRALLLALVSFLLLSCSNNTSNNKAFTKSYYYQSITRLTPSFNENTSLRDVSSIHFTKRASGLVDKSCSKFIKDVAKSDGEIIDVLLVDKEKNVPKAIYTLFTNLGCNKRIGLPSLREMEKSISQINKDATKDLSLDSNIKILMNDYDVAIEFVVVNSEIIDKIPTEFSGAIFSYKR